MIEKDFWISSLKKTFVMFGFTYFSVCVTTQTFTNLTPSFLAAGLYFFTELGRFYKVHQTNNLQRKRKKKIKSFQFLI